MSSPTRGLLTAAGAAVLLVGAWVEGGPPSQAHASAQPAAVLHQGGYAGFTVSEGDRDARLSQEYQGCMDRAQGTVDMRRCAAGEHQRLTRLMDSTFRNAVGRLSQPSARDRLRADQTRWQQGLHDHCRRELRESGEEGGSMGLLVLDGCALSELIRRTLWLEQHR